MCSMAVVAVISGSEGVWWGVLGNKEGKHGGKHGREAVLRESLKLARRATPTPPPNTAMRGRPDMCVRGPNYIVRHTWKHEVFQRLRPRRSRLFKEAPRTHATHNTHSTAQQHNSMRRWEGGEMSPPFVKPGALPLVSDDVENSDTYGCTRTSGGGAGSACPWWERRWRQMRTHSR